MITLGIDPGTARMGYGAVERAEEPVLLDYGVIETAVGVPMQKRLALVYAAVGELIDAHRPTVLAIEQLFFARNVTTAISVGQARGVILLAAALHEVEVVEYSPSEVKHAVVGYGKADKGQIQAMVRLLLRMDRDPYPDDAADALAIALCHVQRSAFHERSHVPPSWS